MVREWSGLVFQSLAAAGPGVLLERKPELALRGVRSPAGDVQRTFPIGGNMSVKQSAVDEPVMILAGKRLRGEVAVDFSPDGEVEARISRADFRSPVVVAEEQQLARLTDHAGFDRNIVLVISRQQRIVQRNPQLAYPETPVFYRGTMQFRTVCVGLEFVKPVGPRFRGVVHDGTDEIVEVQRILQIGKGKLLLIGDAVDLSATRAHLVQRRKKKRRQNGDDRYYIDLKKLIDDRYYIDLKKLIS